MYFCIPLARTPCILRECHGGEIHTVLLSTVTPCDRVPTSEQRTACIRTEALRSSDVGTLFPVLTFLHACPAYTGAALTSCVTFIVAALFM